MIDTAARADEGLPAEHIGGYRGVNFSAGRGDSARIPWRGASLAASSTPMDVRCERCRAQYVFDDDQVTPAGLAVQCTNCGHLFKVKKKELVVTVAVKPDELEAAPLPATAAAPSTASRHPERREWRVRQASGNVFTFRELTTLQKWIVEGKVGRDDEISVAGDHQWRRLGDIAELASFFQVVEDAERARATPAPTPVNAQTIAMYPPPPPSGYPPPSFAVPPPTRPAPPVRTPDPAPATDVELDEDELAAVKGPARGRLVLLTIVLAAVAAAGAYALVASRRPPPREVAVPIVIEVGRPGAEPPPESAASAPAIPAAAPAPTAAADAPPADAPPADAPPVAPGEGRGVVVVEERAPIAAPEIVPEAATAKAPEPVAVATPKVPEAPVAAKPAAPAPKGPKALLAQATRLRERGELEKALDAYGRVAARDPENVDALTGRGLCYLDLSQYPPAEASFEAALGIDPGNADATLGLAETYRWQGKKADAIRYYERYLAEHPDGDEAAVARNALQELRR
jgi:predicted Zn finger-like uncharacterized protein